MTETSYEFALNLHDKLVSMRGRIVRMQTKDGVEWWVEYADRFSGTWKRIG